MSSYIDVAHPGRHAPYLDIPDDVIEYLHYLDFVKLRSPPDSQRVLSRSAGLFSLYDGTMGTHRRHSQTGYD